MRERVWRMVNGLEQSQLASVSSLVFLVIDQLFLSVCFLNDISYHQANQTVFLKTKLLELKFQSRANAPCHGHKHMYQFLAI